MTRDHDTEPKDFFSFLRIGVAHRNIRHAAIMSHRSAKNLL